MDIQKQKHLLDRYEQLPEDVQEAIFSVDTAETIGRIGKENKLNVMQVGILADEVGMLMFGQVKPEEFMKNLSKRLGTDKETVQKLAQEVNARVFAKIRESLRKIHQLEETKTEEKTIDESKVAKEGEASQPISPLIKPRTAPFELSQKAPEMGKAFAPEEEKPYTANKYKEEKVEVKVEKKEEEKKEAPKDFFEERQKEGGFRSKPVLTVHQLAEEEKTKTPAPKPGYRGGQDPYREPVGPTT